jgi:hypothetical protein
MPKSEVVDEALDTALTSLIAELTSIPTRDRVVNNMLPKAAFYFSIVLKSNDFQSLSPNLTPPRKR